MISLLFIESEIISFSAFGIKIENSRFLKLDDFFASCISFRDIVSGTWELHYDRIYFTFNREDTEWCSPVLTSFWGPPLSFSVGFSLTNLQLFNWFIIWWTVVETEYIMKVWKLNRYFLFLVKLVELSKAQDIEAGDGTTSVVVVAGAYLEAAEKLLQRGIHPTIISDAFQKAASKAIEILNAMSTPIELTDKESLIKSASTSLNSKVSYKSSI